jgi:hypothetical protein
VFGRLKQIVQRRFVIVNYLTEERLFVTKEEFAKVLKELGFYSNRRYFTTWFGHKTVVAGDNFKSFKREIIRQRIDKTVEDALL